MLSNFRTKYEALLNRGTIFSLIYYTLKMLISCSSSYTIVNLLTMKQSN